MKCWQDLEKTIPAVKDGDPVAVAESQYGAVFVQDDPARRPVLCSANGGLVEFGFFYDRQIARNEQRQLEEFFQDEVYGVPVPEPERLTDEEREQVEAYLSRWIANPDDPKPDHVIPRKD